jgi:membrane associated rhomboid family serine protease
MLVPIRTDSPLRANPYVNWTLIVLNVLVFTAQLKYPQIAEHLALDPAEPAVAQFFGYQFLHGNVPHLLSNMLFLYIFGNNVNDRMGNLGYLAYYLSGGVFAGVAYMFFGGDAPMVGASGSVSAVTGAFLVLLPRTKVTILFFFVLIGLFEISSMWLILAFFLLDVGRQFAPMAFGGGENVAYGAHIGGTVYGVLVCLGLLATRLLPRDLFDVLALIDRWNRRRQYRDLTRQGYDAFAARPLRAAADEAAGASTARDTRIDRIQDLRASISESVAHRRLPDAARQYARLLAIDPNQVLSRHTQIDVANELFTLADHPNAAAAYELYLRQYSRGEPVEQIQLMLGLIYARYVPHPQRARELLTSALERLTSERERAVAQEELSRLTATAPTG